MFHPTPDRSPVRWIAVVLVTTLLFQAGCAGGMHLLAEEELKNPKPAESYRVTMRDGTEYTFIALHLEGDLLLGTARFTERTVIGEGETRREVVTNRYEEMKLPWADVGTVEADGGRKAGGGMLFALGSIAAGAVLFLLITSGDDAAPTGGGGGKDGL